MYISSIHEALLARWSSVYYQSISLSPFLSARSILPNSSSVSFILSLPHRKLRDPGGPLPIQPEAADDVLIVTSC